MATAHVPSIMSQPFPMAPFESSIYVKPEKILPEDDEPDFNVNKWFTDHVVSCSVNNTSGQMQQSVANSQHSSYNPASCSSVQFGNNLSVGQPLVASAFQPITITQNDPSNSQSSSMGNNGSTYNFPGSFQQMYGYAQSYQLTIPQANSSQGQGNQIVQQIPFVTQLSPQSAQSSGSMGSNQMNSIPHINILQGGNGINFNMAGINGSPMQAQAFVLPFGFPQQQQPLAISPQYFVYAPFQPVNSNNQPVNVNVKAPAQAPEDNLLEERTKRSSRVARSSPRRIRQTRPKVIEAKGAVQCKGKNRKKGTQCRNAALMEYIGPRPVYCAEHIELDPQSLYIKCKSPYQKEVGDKKGCKEVVLKEFGYCYKHFNDLVNEMIVTNDYERAKKHYFRTAELLDQLEKEAAAAKKKDGDLYQRKNKLIPKFQEMKRIMSKTVDDLRPKEEAPIIDDSFHLLTAPVLNLSSEDDEISASSDSDDSVFIGQPLLGDHSDNPYDDFDTSRMIDQLS